MKKLFKLSMLVLVSSLLLTGCGLPPVYNVPTSKLDKRYSKGKVYTAIKEAGKSLGWKITRRGTGVAEGKLILRTHLAIVRITYNANSYSIKYVRSENLKYNAEKGTIHKNYNGWIQNLEKAINLHL
ncbi:MAG: hypothetical protein QM493_10070 [Sulfurovum sp.]